MHEEVGSRAVAVEGFRMQSELHKCSWTGERSLAPGGRGFLCGSLGCLGFLKGHAGRKRVTLAELLGAVWATCDLSHVLTPAQGGPVIPLYRRHVTRSQRHFGGQGEVLGLQ